MNPSPTPTDLRASRRPGAAIALFFLAPLVGEFLLGNLPLNMLSALLLLAPLYGGGAILVRETSRRLGLGWPGLLLLGLTYGVIEEAFVTQSLFNPNYVGLRLLDPAYIPALGMSGWWTVYVLSLHAFWSTAVPIALMETLTPTARRTPWLGPVGLAITAVVFLISCAALLKMELAKGFVASPAQFGWSAVVVIALTAVAVYVGRRTARTVPEPRRSAPSWVVVLVAALVAGAAFFGLTQFYSHAAPWAVTFGSIAVWVALGATVAWWSRAAGWGERHRLALAAGFVLTYAWHAFVQVPSVGSVTPRVDLLTDILFAALAAGLLVFAAGRVRREEIALG